MGVWRLEFGGCSAGAKLTVQQAQTIVRTNRIVSFRYVNIDFAKRNLSKYLTEFRLLRFLLRALILNLFLVLNDDDDDNDDKLK